MMRFGERATMLAGLAARVLGWRPTEFWSATPAEMAASLHEADAIDPVAHDELNALMQRFPDRTE